ncbi:MAG: signal recognition particle-docking protein FtsY [Methylobacter sp.]|nr:MAG: signal recognition particle-docking protein FtsY [Methylobacter sp.]
MFKKLTLLCIFLCFFSIIAGTYLTLSEPGHCPEWAGCSAVDIFNVTEAKSNQFAIDRNLAKSVHYYLLWLLVFSLMVLMIVSCRQDKFKLLAVSVSSSIFVLTILQTVLGIWLAQMPNIPLISIVHWGLGLIVFWILFWLYIRTQIEVFEDKAVNGFVFLVGLCTVALCLQIFWSAWSSLHFALSTCLDFPKCNGYWWPELDFPGALNLMNGLSGVYESPSLPARISINRFLLLSVSFCFIVNLALVLTTLPARKTKAVKISAIFLAIFSILDLTLFIGFNLAPELFWPKFAFLCLSSLAMLPLIGISLFNHKPEHRTNDSFSSIPSELAAELEPDSAHEIKPRADDYQKPAPESLYLRLKSQLSHTRNGLNKVLTNFAGGQKQLSSDFLADIEADLIMADVGIDATAEIINRLTQSLDKKQLADGDTLSQALKQELLNLLKPCDETLHIAKSDKPFVILVIGVNGAGKTTTIGKLAKRLQIQGYSVMLAAGDTFRAAAVEQLQTWGERNQIQVVAQHTGADSASVIFDGLQSAQAKGVDVLIADTAGRLHTKSNLMEELKKVKRIMAKLDESAPHEVLLVLDAGTGQNALSQAKQFNEAVAVTGLVLTKLDGTAKGGVIFALAKQMQIPIRFIGIGEGIDDLQDFNAENFVEALFVKD